MAGQWTKIETPIQVDINRFLLEQAEVSSEGWTVVFLHLRKKAKQVLK